MKNVIGKQKRHKWGNLIFVVLFIILSTYIVLHASYVINHDKTFSGNFKAIQFLDLSGKIADHISNKPFELGLNESKVRDTFINSQKYMLILYIFVALMMWAYMGANKGEFEGIEQGSAEWANEKELKPLRDKDGWYVIGDNLFLNPNSKNETVKELNPHQFIVGRPKCGKSFRKIIADILRASCNFVVVDIKGDIYRNTSNFAKAQGYNVKVLNLIEPKYSMKFNSFKYVQSDTDILVQSETFLRNTEGETAEVKKDFWYKAEAALLNALMFYIYKEMPQEDWNYPNVLKLLLSAINIEAGMDSEQIEISQEITILDTILGELEKKNPEHVALSAWKTFKLNARSPETAAGVMEGLAVRFNVFSTEDIKNLSSNDEIDIDSINDQKTIVYVMIPDTHRTFDVISALFFSTLFQRLIYIADFRERGKLKIHCQCLMDEFVNCGVIPDFDTLLATMRSRELGASIIIQDLSQLKKKYPKNWNSIIGCCDTVIYMGTQEQETREYFSKMLGTTTIKIVGDSYQYNRGKGGRTENVQYQKRELMTADELRTIPNEKQIVFCGSFKAIYVDKYRTEKTPNYKWLSDQADYRDIKREDKTIAEALQKVCQEYSSFVENASII